jgi:hypothetical protein
MSGAGIFWLIVGLIVVGVIIAAIVQGIVQSKEEARILATGTDAERAALAAKKERAAAAQAAAAKSRAWNLETQAHGTLRSQLVCPHCQERGNVMCKSITNKKGISGGKATGAVLTGGVSLLATGLSRKEAATQAFCKNCKSTWQF